MPAETGRRRLMDDDFRRADHHCRRTHDDGRSNIDIFAMLDARVVGAITMAAIRKNAARRADKRAEAGE